MAEQVVDFFTEQSLLEDPFGYYEFVRAQGPVWREPYHGCFVVTGYDEIAGVYRDTDTFSSFDPPRHAVGGIRNTRARTGVAGSGPRRAPARSSHHHRRRMDEA